MPRAGSLFVIEGDRVRPTRASTGPWSPDALHGGPVAALLAHELGARPTSGPMFPARFSLELLRPVGLEAMTVVTSVVRPGRKVQVLEAGLHRDPDAPPSAENLLARATLQQIRAEPVVYPLGTAEINGPEVVPGAPESFPLGRDLDAPDAPESFHATSVEHRTEDEMLGAGGPGLDWMRIRPDLLPGLALTAHERVVALSDFGNGISGVLPVDDYAFINPDLAVFLYRLPIDEWVCLDAVTRLGDDGTGIAESVLFDRVGRIGRAVQTLLIEKR